MLLDLDSEESEQTGRMAWLILVAQMILLVLSSFGSFKRNTQYKQPNRSISVTPLATVAMVYRITCWHWQLDQLAEPTFRYRYEHTPFGSAPVPILLS